MSESCPWDEGLTWFKRCTVPPTELPMTVQHVTSQVLRVANGAVEDNFVRAAIGAATLKCLKDTGRALPPQTWELILSRFPYGRRPIVVPFLPLISVDSIAYVDEDGAEQFLSTSPAEFEVVPSGEFRRARVTPLFNEVWPATRCDLEQAVTVTFTCGHEANEYPEDLLIGIGLLVGELYKTRTLTVDGQTAAQIGLSNFWRKVEG